jgi:hypothetical protein
MESTHPRKAAVARCLSLALALALALALSLATGLAGTAQAGNVEKSKKTQARFVSYDEETRTLVVKVLKPGKKPDRRKLVMKRGKQAKFHVRTAGSILVRTSVTDDGQRSSVTAISVGKILNIYWVPDEDDPNVRFARKIDVVYAEEEIEVRADPVESN